MHLRERSQWLRTMIYWFKQRFSSSNSGRMGKSAFAFVGMTLTDAIGQSSTSQSVPELELFGTLGSSDWTEIETFGPTGRKENQQRKTHSILRIHGIIFQLATLECPKGSKATEKTEKPSQITALKCNLAWSLANLKRATLSTRSTYR